MLVTTMAKRRTRFKLSPCPIPIFFFCFPLPYFFPSSSSYFFFLITNPFYFTSYQCWVVLGVCACLCALSIKVEMSWSACCVKVWSWGQLSILSLVDGELKKQGLIYWFFGFFFFSFQGSYLGICIFDLWAYNTTYNNNQCTNATWAGGGVCVRVRRWILRVWVNEILGRQLRIYIIRQV